MRICINCGSDKTYINKKTGVLHWYKHNDSWYCQKCNNNLFINPKWHPITSKRTHAKWNPITNAKWNPINNPRHLLFKDNIILLKENPRTGVCSICGAVKGIDCVRTSIHHIKYDDSDPLKHTVELCNSCHRKQHEK